MTILSKVKTLIDYAKFAMFLIRANNYDGKNDRLCPLHFPKIYNFNSGLVQYATALTGYVKTLGSGNGWCDGNDTIVYVNLPNLQTINGFAGFSRLRALKECHLPSLRNISNDNLVSCSVLEILEVGSLTYFDSKVMQYNTAVHTFICGKDTACNLYLQYCPLLTQECLHNIIDNLADRTGTTALTLQIGSNIAKLSEEYKLKLLAKNWNLT